MRWSYKLSTVEYLYPKNSQIQKIDIFGKRRILKKRDEIMKLGIFIDLSSFLKQFRTQTERYLYMLQCFRYIYIGNIRESCKIPQK